MKLFSTLVFMLSISMTMATFGAGRFVLTPGVKRSLTGTAIGAMGLGIALATNRLIHGSQPTYEMPVKKKLDKPLEHPVAINKTTEKPFEIHMKSRS